MLLIDVSFRTTLGLLVIPVSLGSLWFSALHLPIFDCGLRSHPVQELIPTIAECRVVGEEIVEPGDEIVRDVTIASDASQGSGGIIAYSNSL